ncbi:hypothetical protein NDU88_002526 [Pleurodeles waltl]|uniref:Uncharacterized protein n=1 Tax=Pleurodeles waltl TaxID=8319 RepID=A0AAV7KTW2_PLEWA|nr:hypothetical protein NDU88_002526 [Pleurodeles waltl]
MNAYDDFHCLLLYKGWIPGSSSRSTSELTIRPARCSPSSGLTSADAAGNNPALLQRPANPEGLAASKAERGECCRGTNNAIKRQTTEKRRAAVTGHGGVAQEIGKKIDIGVQVERRGTTWRR